MKASAVKVKHPELDACELAIEMRTATELSRGDENGIPRSNDVPSDVPLTQLAPRGFPRTSDLALRPAFVPSDDDEYDVATFMHLYDVDLIEAAYRAILKREPDPSGVGFYLEGLRAGRFERIDVIVAMLDSAEGKRHNVRVRGLTLPRLMRRMTSVPLIGYPIRLGLDLLRLPELIRRLHHSIASTAQLAHSRNQQIVDHLNAGSRRSTESISAALETFEANQLQLRTQTAEWAAEVNSRLVSATKAQAARHDQLSAQTSELNSRLEVQVRETSAQIQQIREVHADLSQYSRTELAKLLSHVQQLRRELALQRAHLAVFEEGNELPSNRAELAASTAEAHRSLDAVYVELEDRFRGSRDEVKNSQAFYLQSVQSAPNEDGPVVDLGCGRGEWLELLREAGADAIGVDTNRVMIELCRERGLKVIEQDALSYLRALPDESLRAVTGFHIIEHLPPETLMLLLDQIMRTLRTGGFVAFETPNPDNLFVSSNYFYFDPSHHHPLPSKLVKLFLESSGFRDVAVTPLHPCAEGRFVENDDVSKRLNELFYGPMDYAIEGWKLDR